MAESNKRERVEEFVKFCIVGTICSGIDAVIFYLISSFTTYQVALISGYVAGLVVNYILTVYWTFSQKPSLKNAISVITAHLINLFVIRMGLMWFFVMVMRQSDKIAYVPTIIISVIVNFFMVRFAVTKTLKQS